MTTELKPNIEKAIRDIVRILGPHLLGRETEELKQALRDLVSATLANR